MKVLNLKVNFSYNSAVKHFWRNVVTVTGDLMMHSVLLTDVVGDFCSDGALIVANLPRNFPGPEATPTRPHPLLVDTIFVLNCILKQEVPRWKIQLMRRFSMRSKEEILGMCSFQHKWASERQLYLFVLLHVIMK